MSQPPSDKPAGYADAAHPESPATLGKYVIERVLGSGAMGVVYRAFDPHIQRVVALKTIRAELFDAAAGDDLVARFRNEAQAAGRLSHPNIVAVYDYGEQAGTAYLAMEFVDGQGLNTLLADTPKPARATALAWFGQLLDALGYAHEKGVVHRDIKPANLLLTDRGHLKVTDFGIAHIDSSTLTQLGAVVGTPSYMSPEQFIGERVDGRADLFSAAVVLYQMLTGERPFAGSATTVMQKILNEAPRRPTEIDPTLPAALDTVLLRALAKQPAQRYADAAALQAALQAAFQPGAAGPDADRTVLATQGPLPPAGAGGDAFGHTSSGATPADLPATLLAEIEAHLTAQVGPVARVLVRRAAMQAADIAQLAALLDTHIPSARGREQFAAALRKLGVQGQAEPDAGALSTRTAPALPAAMTGPALTAEQIAGAAARLAVYMGPIAPLIAKRTAPRATSLAGFHELLAECITNPTDRARFRRDVGLP